jgi:hypothetical protein
MEDAPLMAILSASEGPLSFLPIQTRSNEENCQKWKEQRPDDFPWGRCRR